MSGDELGWNLLNHLQFILIFVLPYWNSMKNIRLAKKMYQQYYVWLIQMYSQMVYGGCEIFSHYVFGTVSVKARESLGCPHVLVLGQFWLNLLLHCNN